MKAPPRRRVPCAELRQRFNAGGYAQRLEEGTLRAVLKDECRATSRDEPPGTRSQTVADPDEQGQRIVLVHQYLRPDGSIGGSGRPDPKWLLEGGIVYFG